MYLPLVHFTHVRGVLVSSVNIVLSLLGTPFPSRRPGYALHVLLACGRGSRVVGCKDFPLNVKKVFV